HRSRAGRSRCGPRSRRRSRAAAGGPAAGSAFRLAGSSPSVYLGPARLWRYGSKHRRLPLLGEGGLVGEGFAYPKLSLVVVLALIVLSGCGPLESSELKDSV